MEKLKVLNVLDQSEAALLAIAILRNQSFFQISCPWT